MSPTFPTDIPALEELQEGIGRLSPEPWILPESFRAGACFVCFRRGGTGAGAAGDEGWTAAVTMSGSRIVAHDVVSGRAGAPYVPGFLAAREGPLLAAAVVGLDPPPDVLLVNAAGRDHERGAGMAVQLGWALDLPTVGVTHRPRLATGDPPLPRRGSYSPLRVGGLLVGAWVCTRDRTRPVAVSAGWRTDPATAVDVVLAAGVRARTPEPLRRARTLARLARAGREPARPAA